LYQQFGIYVFTGPKVEGVIKWRSAIFAVLVELQVAFLHGDDGAVRLVDVAQLEVRKIYRAADNAQAKPGAVLQRHHVQTVPVEILPLPFVTCEINDAELQKLSDLVNLKVSLLLNYIFTKELT